MSYWHHVELAWHRVAYQLIEAQENEYSSNERAAQITCAQR